MANIGNIRHRTHSLLVVTALVAVSLSVAVPVSATPFPDANVTITGHGYGPGVGMGQWGAFGFSVMDHWTYHQLLVHYYSDAAYPVTDATLSPVRDGQLVTVAIEENDGDAVLVTSPTAFTYTSGGRTVATISGGHVGKSVENTTTGLWTLYTSTSCSSSSWTSVASNLTDPTAVPADLQADAPLSDLLTVCRGDGAHVTYRGRIEAYNYDHSERTINVIAMEQYLSDVVPGESPSVWGTLGGTSGAPEGHAWGFQELETQAVAARTYLLYEVSIGGWSAYADICDNYCEYYAAGIADESSIATAADRDTAGQYLVQSGEPAPTEYSSSSGGYTEPLDYWNGKSIFDGIRDLGDAVCLPEGGGCNPYHTWNLSIPVKTVEAAFPSVGVLESVKVTATDSSGRVTSIEVVGESATRTVSGGTFANDFDGFLSTLFTVTDGPGASSSPEATGRQVPLGGAPGMRPPALLPVR